MQQKLQASDQNQSCLHNVCILYIAMILVSNIDKVSLNQYSIKLLT